MSGQADPNKSGKHGHAPQMSAGEESWRDEAGKQQKDESGQVGDENSAMLAKEVHVRRLPLVDFSASELVSTATSRMAPEAIGSSTGHRQHEDQITDDSNDERPDHGSRQPAAAAKKTNTANDCRGHGRQNVVFANGRRSCSGLRGQVKRRQRRKHSGKAIGRNVVEN